jgi:hypothetical protein
MDNKVGICNTRIPCNKDIFHSEGDFGSQQRGEATFERNAAAEMAAASLQGIEEAQLRGHGRQRQEAGQNCVEDKIAARCCFPSGIDDHEALVLHVALFHLLLPLQFGASPSSGSNRSAALGPTVQQRRSAHQVKAAIHSAAAKAFAEAVGGDAGPGGGHKTEEEQEKWGRRQAVVANATLLWRKREGWQTGKRPEDFLPVPAEEGAAASARPNCAIAVSNLEEFQGFPSFINLICILFVLFFQIPKVVDPPEPGPAQSSSSTANQQQQQKTPTDFYGEKEGNSSNRKPIPDSGGGGAPSSHRRHGSDKSSSQQQKPNVWEKGAPSGSNSTPLPFPGQQSHRQQQRTQKSAKHGPTPLPADGNRVKKYGGGPGPNERPHGGRWELLNTYYQ